MTSSSRNYKIICTPTFLKEARKLAKKYPHIKSDYLSLSKALKKNPLIGDSLGGGIFKIRMEISDKGQGKSGSARVIIQVKIVDRQVFVLRTYDKAEFDTVITDVLKKEALKGDEK